MPRWRDSLRLTLLFVLLTGLMTWPQALVLGTHAAGDQDVFFNLWRLRWIAHALATAPHHLFDGNMFYPERNVLAYSDAMLAEGILSAPLQWTGVPPVLIHNLVLLGGIVASAVGIVVLARHLTGSTAAAIVSGVVFAFAPYRFDHYKHLELQWTVWTPWAFWALQRALETGSVRFGVITGVCVALQMASSVYYGVFLSVLIAVVAALQLLTLRGRHLRHGVRSLLVAGAIAATLSGLYLLPYAAASKRVGTRTESEVTVFSARPQDYLAATRENLLYGTAQRRVHERVLFPGTLPVLLALTGLLLVPPTTITIAYIVGLIVAFELSLGSFGVLYPVLYEHVAVFRALRAPARASIFVLFFIGVLAAQGMAAVTALCSRRLRDAIVALACAIVLLEYWVAPLQLSPYHNNAPPLYAFLARLPRGVVAEFPMPEPSSPPRHDPRFAYMSTFHWKPLVNGYSGFFPPSYLERLNALSGFPDPSSIERLRRERVRYVVVHADGYPPGERERIVERLLLLGLTHVAEFEDGWSVGTIMEVR